MLGDGAMGTMLHMAGLTDGAPERWNAERPDVVLAIHRAYVDAGSDFISTNTFGGTRNRLALDGLEGRLAELNEAGARLAREAAGDRLVAGSMGPTGELMEPLGLLTPDGARASFAEQARSLKAGGVDFALIETMSALEEVQAAVEGAREAGLPAVVTMSFDTHFHTMMGVSPVKALAAIAGLGVRVIGANCGNGPAEIERIMTEMSQAKPERRAADGEVERGHAALEGRPNHLRRHARGDGGLCAQDVFARRLRHRRLLRQHAGAHRGHAPRARRSILTLVRARGTRRSPGPGMRLQRPGRGSRPRRSEVAFAAYGG